MSLLYPDILEHNNSNRALIDALFVRGGYLPVDDLTARNDLPSDKRKLGMLISWDTISGRVIGVYEGSDLTDVNWQNNGNWTILGTGMGNGDMLASVYDPQSIIGDAFDRANHTGTQAESTIITKYEYIVIACSDEITDLTAVTDVATFRIPFACTVTAVRADVNTAPTGSTIIVDINENGATILGTKLTIDAGETTSVTAAIPPVISDTSLAENAEISIDIDQIGASVAGAGLRVTLIVTRS